MNTAKSSSRARERWALKMALIVGGGMLAMIAGAFWSESGVSVMSVVLAEVGLIAMAVGMLIRRDPTSRLPEGRTLRWAFLGIRATAVLVPAVVPLAIVVQLDRVVIPSASQEIRPLVQGGEYAHVPNACRLVDIRIVRDIALTRARPTRELSGPDLCRIEWRTSKGGAALSVQPRLEQGVDTAQDARKQHRGFCRKNANGGVLASADACVSALRREEQNPAEWERVLAVRDSNLIVEIVASSELEPFFTDARMARLADAVRKGLAR